MQIFCGFGYVLVTWPLWFPGVVNWVCVLITVLFEVLLSFNSLVAGFGGWSILVYLGFPGFPRFQLVWVFGLPVFGFQFSGFSVSGFA